jgi:hypothetical protein
MKQFLVILTTGIFCASLSAQEEGEENERVRYVLILPEEKTPELVKPEENNPFEAAATALVEKEGNTEENQVRDLLLRMSVGGAVSGLKGMRVMLGGMRLEEGMDVPPVIPDQQVVLRVKSITRDAIELVWVDNRPTGLPPKLLVIPMDGSPSVRYRMPAGVGGSTPGAGDTMGTMRRSDVSSFSNTRELNERSVASANESAQEPPKKVEAAKPKAPAVDPSQKKSADDTPAASVLRMLFGKQPPVGR